MNKIYIVGNVGSGKTTFANKLSKALNIKSYELDSLVWNNKSIRRSDNEILKLFNEIIKKDKWIIEDPGRDIFKEGIKKADIVILLDISNYVIKIRLLKRWIKQVLKVEKCNYNPSIKMLFKMYKWANKNIKNREKYISFLKSNVKHLLILNEKEINNFDIRSYYENI